MHGSLGIVFIVLGVVCAVVSLLQFLEKGVPFNNAYIWRSPAEREALNKKPYYRQSAIAFALAAACLLLLELELLLATGILLLFVGLFAAGLVVYALVSSARIEAEHDRR